MQAKQIRLLKTVLISLVVIVVVLNAVSFKTRQNTIYVGTKNLTEQQIIANLYKVIIEENTNYNLRIISGLDTTAFVQSALLSGDIDMYVEYTSTAYLEVFDHKFNSQSKDEIVKTLMKDYDSINLSLNSLLGFENSNAIICSSYCSNIDEISQLSGQSFTFAAPAYFFSRSDGYNLLAKKYDFSNVEIVKADPIVIYQGILNDQIDVGLGFTTDAKLTNPNIKVLTDTAAVFPSYDAMLVTSKEFKQNYPKASDELDKISGTITTAEIQKLNNQVENEGQSPKVVATRYATEKNYI